MAKLTPDPKARHFQGTLRYFAVANTSSGRKNRYDLFLLCGVGDPVRIGCEINLRLCNELIKEYENLASPNWWGDRAYLVYLRGCVSKFRLKRSDPKPPKA